MKKSKFTEEQSAFALEQAETGKTIEEICRKTEDGHLANRALQLAQEVRRAGGV